MHIRLRVLTQFPGVDFAAGALLCKVIFLKNVEVY